MAGRSAGLAIKLTSDEVATRLTLALASYQSRSRDSLCIFSDRAVLSLILLLATNPKGRATWHTAGPETKSTTCFVAMFDN